MIYRLSKILSLLVCAAVLFFACTITPTAETILGDADGDGEVTILDVTCIQKKLAKLSVGNFSVIGADVDGNGEISIIDATCIQRYLARIKTPYSIGEDIEAPTEAPTIEPPTTAPTTAPTQLPTDADGWGYIIYRP